MTTLQPPQTFCYRRATAADTQALLELGVTAYSICKHDMPESGWEELKGKLEDLPALEAIMRIATVFVCEAAGKIAGKAFFIPQGNPTAIYPAGWAYIRKVGVHPACTGQGIATHLTQLCMDEAVAQGAHTIALHTSEIMHAARHIYEKLGFRIVKELPPQFGVRYFLYAMQLCIS